MPFINLSLNLVKYNRFAVARDHYSCERRGPLASCFCCFFLYKASSQEAVAMVILRNML